MKQILCVGLVTSFFLAAPYNSFAAGKSLEVVKGKASTLIGRGFCKECHNVTPSVALTYERACLGGLEFVTVIAPALTYGRGTGIAVNPNIVQVMGKNGKPKTCK